MAASTLRLRWLFVLAAAVLALALASGTAEAQTPSRPDDDVLLALGTRSQCELRTLKKQYCADLFDTIASVTAFWVKQMPKLSPSGQVKYTPPAYVKYFELNVPLFKVDCSDEATPAQRCVMAHYDYSGVVINEALLIREYEKNAPGAMSALTLAWSHHAQDLLYRNPELAPGVDDRRGEFQALCHAGMWAGEQLDAGKWDRPTLNRAMSYFYDVFGPGVSDNPLQQGSSLLAWRMGYETDDALWCAKYKFGEEPPGVDYVRYVLALPVDAEHEVLKAGSGVNVEADYIYRGDTLAVAIPLIGLASQPAASLLESTYKSFVTLPTRFLDAYTDLSLPYRGAVTQKVFDESTWAAKRVEVTLPNKDLAHGLAYLFVRSSGSGFLLVVLDQGPSDKANWAGTEDNLNLLLVGLVLK